MAQIICWLICSLWQVYSLIGLMQSTRGRDMEFEIRKYLLALALSFGYINVLIVIKVCTFSGG